MVWTYLVNLPGLIVIYYESIFTRAVLLAVLALRVNDKLVG